MPKPDNQPSEQTALTIESLIGSRLKGQYLLLEKLGQGGMGVVFRAVNESLQKPLAVKFLLTVAGQGLDRPEAEARFRREIQLAAQMAHANIAQVFDCGVEAGFPYMVMEYVEGPDLSDIIKREGPLVPARALEIVKQIAVALSEADRCNVVHRDIKPQNIKLQRYKPGGHVYIKVLDFGLAKNVRDRQDELTKPGTLMGTPSYMAPEQIRGGPISDQRVSQSQVLERPAGGIDQRADLYSTGIILYEMLSGKLPFEGPMAEVLGGHLFRAPPPLPITVPKSVRALVEKLLNKEPLHRYQNANELLHAIIASEGAIAAAHIGEKFNIVWLIIAVLTGAFITGGTSLLIARRPDAKRDVTDLGNRSIQPIGDFSLSLDLALPTAPPDLLRLPALAAPRKPQSTRKVPPLTSAPLPLSAPLPAPLTAPSACPVGTYRDELGRCAF